jgi:hypothetical protein
VTRPGRHLSLRLALLVLLAGPAEAEESKDKKEEPKPQPPRVAFALPLAVPAGKTNLVRIRGQNLTNVTEVRFTNATPDLLVALKSKGKADVPKDADAKKVGDTMVSVDLFFPAAAAGTTNWFVLANEDGTSEPRPLVVLRADDLIEEQEPNGGFKTAQPIHFGQTVAGRIQEAGDVDVFHFPGRRGQKIQLEIAAARLGSSLDSIVTLTDQNGHVLASVDDNADGLDSVLVWTLPEDGEYCASVVDAHDKGGLAHLYLLRLSGTRSEGPLK